jgi:hypothetical protein
MTYAIVKVQYQDELHKIPATEVKKDRGRLLVFDGERQVGEFDLDKIEHWSLEEGKAAAAVATAGGFRAD